MRRENERGRVQERGREDEIERRENERGRVQERGGRMREIESERREDVREED